MIKIIVLSMKEMIDKLKPCSNCRDVKIKKFAPIRDYPDYDKLNKDFFRCSCGKRPIDIVMGNILKTMVEEGTVLENATLRRNSPVPMPSFCYSTLNPQFLGEDSLILIHPDFDKEVAEKLIEIPEVKGVLKGNPADTVGIRDIDSDFHEFELLEGKSDRIDVIRTLVGEDIIISKDQKNTHIEVAPTTENKLLKVYNYLETNDVNLKIAFDGMCGSGAVGIFLLKYGFEKVIFNDINPQAITTLKKNLKLNKISDERYEIYNEAIEDLKIMDVDLTLLDPFPGVDIEGIKDNLDNVLII